MVHIRAVPEGGPAGSNPGTNLPFTFYDRFTATTPQTLPRSIDRRQPLPSAFAARWSYGDRFSGVMTTYQIWREGLTGPSSTSCTVAPNASIPLQDGEIVRFDEHENSNSIAPNCIITCLPFPRTAFPGTSSAPLSSSLFPDLTPYGD